MQGPTAACDWPCRLTSPQPLWTIGPRTAATSGACAPTGWLHSRAAQHHQLQRQAMTGQQALTARQQRGVPCQQMPVQLWPQQQPERVPVWVDRGVLRLQADTSVPLILIGTGTGVAPFRAFLEERAALKAAGVMPRELQPRCIHQASPALSRRLVALAAVMSCICSGYLAIFLDSWRAGRHAAAQAVKACRWMHAAAKLNVGQASRHQPPE